LVFSDKGGMMGGESGGWADHMNVRCAITANDTPPVLSYLEYRLSDMLALAFES